MHAFYINLFSPSAEQNPRLQILARLTTLSRANLERLTSDLGWNVWH
jgi:hypothetical protein